jgi:hypothetical protein
LHCESAEQPAASELYDAVNPSSLGFTQARLMVLSVFHATNIPVVELTEGMASPFDEPPV